MTKITLPALPESRPKSDWRAIWVNAETQEKVRQLSDTSGISMYRLTDYIVNMALKEIELVPLDE